MKIIPKVAYTLLAIFLTFGAFSSSYAQEMSMDQYKQRLAAAQKREADAKACQTQVQAEIDAAKEALDETNAAITQAWDEIYAMLGVTRADVDAYRAELAAIEAQVDGLMALSPEELFARRKEIDEAQAKLDEKKKSKIALLSEMQDKIATIDGKITRLRNKLPKSMYDNYTVMRGDYLWRISGKQDIYGDPYQWMRIYSYNRDQIKDADLIYPDQVFKIQRGVGPDEYLVAKGDYLAKITQAAAKSGGPGAWRALYEANKDIIGDDPSMIYPYTVLRLPK